MLRLEAAWIDVVQAIGIDDGDAADGEWLDAADAAKTVLALVPIEREGGERVLAGQNLQFVGRGVAPDGAEPLTARAVAGARLVQIQRPLRMSPHHIDSCRYNDARPSQNPYPELKEHNTKRTRDLSAPSL